MLEDRGSSLMLYITADHLYWMSLYTGGRKKMPQHFSPEYGARVQRDAGVSAQGGPICRTILPIHLLTGCPATLTGGKNFAHFFTKTRARSARCGFSGLRALC